MLRKNNKKQKDMAKYYANFSVNNGSHLGESLKSSNKFNLWKEVKEWARGQLYYGNHGSCWVLDEEGRTVFEAKIKATGSGKFYIYTTVYNYREKRY